MLLDLSRRSKVASVASTGYHLDGFYEPSNPILRLREDELTRLYRKELTLGMLPAGTENSCEHTGILAGVVKAAIPREGPTGGYRARLTAAARAAALAGRTLMLHTEAGENALAALELCFRCGLSPNRILVCHADRQAGDVSVHEAIAETGVYLEYDTIGRWKYHTDEAEAALILAMLKRGYEARLLLSLDTTARRLGAYGGEITLNYLLRTFLPMLSAAGATKNDSDAHR
jgi:phosphotriesterase-related protein